jgi:hypothetical protein
MIMALRMRFQNSKQTILVPRSQKSLFIDKLKCDQLIDILLPFQLKSSTCQLLQTMLHDDTTYLKRVVYSETKCTQDVNYFLTTRGEKAMRGIHNDVERDRLLLALDACDLKPWLLAITQYFIPSAWKTMGKAIQYFQSKRVKPVPYRLYTVATVLG